MEKMYRIPYIIAIIATHIMCIVVTYTYVSLFYCGKYEGCSAPANTAFLYLIPFGIFIIICVVIGYILQRRYKSKK